MGVGAVGAQGPTCRGAAGEAEAAPSGEGAPPPGGSPPPRSWPLSSARLGSIVACQLPWATAR